MKIVVFGGSGMLGHKLVQVLPGYGFETVTTLRGNGSREALQFPGVKVVTGVDVEDAAALARVLDSEQPDAVLNAVGIIKQAIGNEDEAETIAINALYPQRLAEFCRMRGIRLIHYSTDCVFSGLAESVRGPDGYREEDRPDARDTYGFSKLLGEPKGMGCLVLRTSMIGRELRGHRSLVDWFLSQRDDQVSGFVNALFTGLPTVELARITAHLLRYHREMEGIWHVAAEPISKYELLCLVREAFGRSTPIVPDDKYHCDRRLDGSCFRAAVDWKPAPWRDLVAAMHADTFPYGDVPSVRLTSATAQGPIPTS